MAISPAKTKVVDCDTHFWQPLELWVDYIEPAFRQPIIELNPTTIDPDKLKAMMAEASKPLVEASAERAGGGSTAGFQDGHVGGVQNTLDALKIKGGDYPDARIEWMDSEGVDACVIYTGNAGITYNADG